MSKRIDEVTTTIDLKPSSVHAIKISTSEASAYLNGDLDMNHMIGFDDAVASALKQANNPKNKMSYVVIEIEKE